MSVTRQLQTNITLFGIPDKKEEKNGIYIYEKIAYTGRNPQ